MSNDAHSGDGKPPGGRIDWSKKMFFGAPPLASPNPASDPAGTLILDQQVAPALPTPFQPGSLEVPREALDVATEPKEQVDFTGTITLTPEPREALPGPIALAPVVGLPEPAIAVPVVAPPVIVGAASLFAQAPAAPTPVIGVVHSTPAQQPALVPVANPPRKPQVAAVPARPPRAWKASMYRGFGSKK